VTDSRMEVKIDEIQRDIADIKVTLAVNTVSLQDHMKRTELLETKIENTWSKALTIVSLIAGLTAVAKLLLF
jgi:hypothetical protein